MIQRRLIHWHQSLERSVGIGEGLEVDHEFPGPVAAPQVVDAILYLFADRLQPADRFGAEGVIVTVSATSHRHGPVSVGTGEPAINNHFVNPAAELFLEEGSV